MSDSEDDKHIQNFLNAGRDLKETRAKVTALEGELIEARTKQGVELAERDEAHRKECSRYEATIAQLRSAMNAAEKREHEMTIKAEYWVARFSGLQARADDLKIRGQQLLDAVDTFGRNIVKDEMYRPSGSVDQQGDMIEESIRRLSIVKQGPQI